MTVNVPGSARAALEKKLNLKLGEFDPRGSDRLALPDTEAKTPHGGGFGCRCDREINVETAMYLGQLVPGTAPEPTPLHVKFVRST